MNKTEFIAAIATKSRLPRAKADEAVIAVLVSTEQLKKGEKVTLSGFGSFEVRHRAARPGRNFRTQEKITIPTGKRPAFAAGAVLKAAVSNKRSAKPTKKN